MSTMTIIRSAFTGFTRLSKALGGILVLGFLVTYFVPSSRDYLYLQPGKTIPYAWNLLTAGYTEVGPINLIVNVISLLFAGKILEPIWGSKEFLKFIIVVNLLTAISTFAISVVLYAFTLKEIFLYPPISGFHGVIAGTLVAVKQLMPDQEITLFSGLKFRAKWLPTLAVLTSIIICSAFGAGIVYLPFIIFGTYNSWMYLRFYQKKSEANLKGDPSDEFAFYTFFPEFLQPSVKVLANIGGLVCGRRAAPKSDDGEAQLLGAPLPGSDSYEAERRRTRGAKALEDRLNSSKGQEIGQPSVDAALAPAAPSESDADEKV